MDRRARLAGARLYLCTPDRPDLADFLEEVLAGGVDIVQLREKGIEARRELALLALVRQVAERHGALWSVNDRADVAYASGADVLHLGQDDLPVSVARALLRDDVRIGRSTHDPAQVAAAAVEPGVDYYCVGPTWPTPTKPGRPAPGLDLVRYAASRETSPDTSLDTFLGASLGAPLGLTLGTDRPWFAIGGIGLDNLHEVLAAGATRVVVVRALTEAADPRAAAQELKARLEFDGRP